MKLLPLLAASALTATPVFAEETRQLDAHEHGVGQLDIAFDGQNIAMELHAPGADIVGFEYQATSDQDLAAIETALATLEHPLELFTFPDAASCSVVTASAELESDEHGDHHDDDHHDEHEEHHDDHEGHKDEHDEHHDDHEEHKDEHDEHHDDHEEHKDEHDEHHDDHEEHTGEAGHTEFHATYLLNCAAPSAATDLSFAYFEAFPNALEIEVQVISDKGATSFEVERDTPALDLRSAL